ncbi:MAG: replication initiator protein [Microvirus sp.]|nr:MAG: replication initiator protein [Microvirus sp.]
MPCYSPYQGWKARKRNSSGKRSIVFQLSEGMADEPVEVPCGQCIGCRIVRARQWAVRCIHEASQHSENAFITLTYDEAHCPRSVSVRDVQLFMKRLRERTGSKIRYFCVGEYGEKFSRPHYHLLLFGFDFSDKKYWCGKGKSRQYRSELLESLWTAGFSTVGTVTPASAQYVAQYCTKIVTGKKKAEHYGDRRPEFAIMSRKPGLGFDWLQQYGNVLFERDFVVVSGGSKLAIPRFYLEKFPDDIKAKIKAFRKERMDYHPDSRGIRSIARAECAFRKVQSERRGFEREANCL